jgi:hypothetical protein
MLAYSCFGFVGCGIDFLPSLMHINVLIRYVAALAEGVGD